jgi:hypothetical protein
MSFDGTQSIIRKINDKNTQLYVQAPEKEAKDLSPMQVLRNKNFYLVSLTCSNLPLTFFTDIRFTEMLCTVLKSY